MAAEDNPRRIQIAAARAAARVQELTMVSGDAAHPRKNHVSLTVSLVCGHTCAHPCALEPCVAWAILLALIPDTLHWPGCVDA